MDLLVTDQELSDKTGLVAADVAAISLTASLSKLITGMVSSPIRTWQEISMDDAAGSWPNRGSLAETTSSSCRTALPSQSAASSSPPVTSTAYRQPLS